MTWCFPGLKRATLSPSGAMVESMPISMTISDSSMMAKRRHCMQTEWLEQLPLQISGDHGSYDSNARSGKAYNDIHGTIAKTLYGARWSCSTWQLISCILLSQAPIS